MNITAAILTYNRLSFLKKIIEALKNQSIKPDRIVVVNNSSSDGTSSYLASLDDVEVITQGNYGSSGGQFAAVKHCYETGSEWIWLMDDDVVPRRDCLEKLIQNINEHRIHAPIRINPDGKVNQGDTIELNLSNPFKSLWKVIAQPEIPAERFVKAESLTFEGPLFHRNLVSVIGLPEFSYFIFGDDTDYFIRAFKKNYECYIITDSVIDRLLPVGNLVKFDWKTYYIIRNIIAIDVLNAPMSVRLIRPFRYFVAWLIKSKSFSDVKVVMKALADGYFFKQSNQNIEFNRDNNIIV